MPDQTVRVGDVVAWDDVPVGALVLDRCGSYSNRQSDGGYVVGVARLPNSWESRSDMISVLSEGPWVWNEMEGPAVTIIALNLIGNETADELRAMAERFEIRQALKPWMCEDTMCWGRWFVTLGWPGDIDMAEGWGDSKDAALEMATQRLHDAGWKPTMGPEDAQRLIEANADRETAAAVAEITAIINRSE